MAKNNDNNDDNNEPEATKTKEDYLDDGRQNRINEAAEALRFNKDDYPKTETPSDFPDVGEEALEEQLSPNNFDQFRSIFDKSLDTVKEGVNSLILEEAQE